MSEPVKSPLARLVLFMVCLSVAGAFLAGAHYYTIDLPQQQNLQAPTNAQNYCIKHCYVERSACTRSCTKTSVNSCRSDCLIEYAACESTC